MVWPHRYLGDERRNKYGIKEKGSKKDHNFKIPVAMGILTMMFWKTDANELPGCDRVFQREFFHLVWCSATEIHKKSSVTAYGNIEVYMNSSSSSSRCQHNFQVSSLAAGWQEHWLLRCTAMNWRVHRTGLVITVCHVSRGTDSSWLPTLPHIVSFISVFFVCTGFSCLTSWVYVQGKQGAWHLSTANFQGTWTD